MNRSENPSSAPIGIFDSGVGGLSVWREIAHALPHESTLYIADQAHIPYGPRPAATLRVYAEGIAEYLIASGCKAIVVACNAASAAALMHLRERFPQMPFIGMEPAIKPAAASTRSGTVTVLATPATLAGELFASTAQKYAQGVQLIGEPCPGLVELIEAGLAQSAETEALLREFLAPTLAGQSDHIVLACTHYPFVIEAIRRIVGPQLTVIDPAPAVARQLARVLDERGIAAHSTDPATYRFFTTAANRARLGEALRTLIARHEQPQQLYWDESGPLRLMSDRATMEAIAK